MTLLKKTLSTFLDSHCRDESPLLLGLSGGPDSMALFYLLYRLKKPFAVAHIDHGWREESRKEALYLESLCGEKRVPFHLLTLTEEDFQKGNSEDEARKKRLHFFKQIVEKEGYEAVILGHHADDQAETVLKRVFEGSPLTKLSGLRPVTFIEELKVFRPLLDISKSEILAWLDEKEITYFCDRTNSDPRFLRSRLRHDLLPLLSEKFGKEVAPSLCRLGLAAQELDELIDQLVAKYEQVTHFESFKAAMDFSLLTPESNFEWKTVLRHFFSQNRISLSNHLLESILAHLKQNSAHKQLRVGQHTLFIDRRRMILELSS